MTHFKRSAVLHRSSKPTPIIQPSKPTPEKKFPQTQQTHTEKKKKTLKRNKPTLKNLSKKKKPHIEKKIHKRNKPTPKKQNPQTKM